MKVYLFVFFLLFGSTGYGQTGLHPHWCSKAQRPRVTATMPLQIADQREDDYDVHFVHLDIALNNLNTQIAGRVRTRARVVAPTMDAYVFELIDTLSVDSVLINGHRLPVVSTGNVRAVPLPAALNEGQNFEAEVYYHGQPDYSAEFFTTGIRNGIDEETGTQVTYTLSEPYGAKDWWPCKQSLKDKIDSADIWIRVPAGLKAGSNGLLAQVTDMGNGEQRYEWKSRYPIDFYLISAAVGPYTEYSYYMQFAGSTDSMLFQNYVYPNEEHFNFWKASIDSTVLMIDYFSELFGRYPFWKEKYGHCLVPLGGGMEHQTMTSQGNFNTSLTAHELGHQWFGDEVTCGSWQDIWLNEGFATYADYLFVHRFQGAAAANAMMQSMHDDVMRMDDGAVYCSDTGNIDRIFDGRLTYSKAAAVVHTLRYIIDDDVLFFGMLRAYLAAFSHGTATTAQFQAFAEQYLGRSLDTFIQEWIYGEGFPVYQAAWNQVDNQVIVRLQQSTTAPQTTGLFRTPVEVRLVSDGADTVLRFQQNTGTEVFAVDWAPRVLTVELDPHNYILNRTDSIRRDRSLVSLAGYDTLAMLLYPNPGSDYWLLEGMPAHCRLGLYDLAGRLLWRGENGQSNAIKIPGRNLAPGVYILRLQQGEGIDRAFRLLKVSL
jgi:aminopeptidase N